MPTQKKSLLARFLVWRLKHISHKQFINIVSAIVGLLAGLAAVTIKNITHFIQLLLEGELIKEIHQAFYFIFPIIGLLFVLLLIKYLIKKKVEPGIPFTLYSISKLKGIMPKHQMWTSLLTAPVTVGFGGSVGLEAPTVATSAALSSNLSGILHLNQTTRTLLLGAAAAGAMSSIFKAPIAAIVFAVEIFSLELTMASMIPLLLASVMAVLTSYFFLGDDVLLHFQIQDKFQLNDVLFYILLGVTSATTSIYFSKVYFAVDSFFKRFSNPYKRLIIGGSLLGIIVFFIPPLFGEGYETINTILRGGIDEITSQNIFNWVSDEVWVLIIFLVGLVTFKVVAMSFTLGAGGVGGVFAPTLFTGSISGYVFALIINQSNLFSHQLSATNFAMVGMAGLIAGVLQAPLTAIFLIAEITGGYELFIPLMIVAAISFLVTKKYIPHNIYAAELAKRGELITHDKDQAVLTLMDVSKLIETNFVEVTPTMTLKKIVKHAIIVSNRNIFPVVEPKTQMLKGIILMDDLRPIMFNKSLYKKITAEEIMINPRSVIDIDSDSMKTIMKKFQDTGAWNLPVIKDNKYYGFISKSKLLTAYRRKLIEFSAK